MDLDTKQKVLIAIYTEYQKDLYSMTDAITPDNLGVTRGILYTALLKLDNEYLINGIETVYGGPSRLPQQILIDDMKPSKAGIEYVESKLGINKDMSGKEKAESVHKTLIEQGQDMFTDFAAKVVAEIIKSQINS